MRIFVLVCFAVMTAAAAQYCHDCQVIINQCKAAFKHDFSTVSEQDLMKELDYLCDQNFAGFDNGCCKQAAANKTPVILNDLKHSVTAIKVCAHCGFC